MCVCCMCVPSLQPVGPQPYPVFYAIVATPVRHVIAKRYKGQRVLSKPNSQARSGQGNINFPSSACSDTLLKPFHMRRS